MSSRSSIEQALAQPTLCAAFQVTAAANAQLGALRTVGRPDVITWADYARRVQAIATGLSSLGVGAGDVVCMMVGNRPEFHLVDTAVMHLGAAACSMYLTNPAEKIVPLVLNADARVIVTEPEYVERIMKVADQVRTVEHIVVIGAAGTDPRQLTLSDLERREHPGFDFEATWRAVRPDTSASLGHTSGTTGEPKGVEFSHGALMFAINSINRLSPPSPGGRWISYLPMAHLGERYMSHYSSLAFGYEIFSLTDGRQIVDALREVRPTRFFSVPRVYEKLAALGTATAEGRPDLAQALAVTQNWIAARQNETSGGESAPESVEALRTLAPVRAELGLDRVEYFGLGAAPPPVAVLERLHALGIPALECYGMSETALVLSNSPSDYKLGTVGHPMPGVEARIADDGELLIRCAGLFSRYRHDPTSTAESIEPDGWFHTGDVAALGDDGFYRIIDRKKELIITATGKNVAPRLVENLVSQGSLLISQVVAIGDGRRNVAALIVLDPDMLASRGIDVPIAEAADLPAVRDEVAAAVASANEHLSRAEAIRSWSIVHYSWSPGGDELTTTGKLKRAAVNDKYAQTIEALYS